MELKILCEKTTELFEIENISELSDKLISVCLENQHEYMKKFAEAVEDLSWTGYRKSSSITKQTEKRKCKTIHH